MCKDIICENNNIEYKNKGGAKVLDTIEIKLVIISIIKPEKRLLFARDWESRGMGSDGSWLWTFFLG